VYTVKTRESREAAMSMKLWRLFSLVSAYRKAVGHTTTSSSYHRSRNRACGECIGKLVTGAGQVCWL